MSPINLKTDGWVSMQMGAVGHALYKKPGTNEHLDFDPKTGIGALYKVVDNKWQKIREVHVVGLSGGGTGGGSSNPAITTFGRDQYSDENKAKLATSKADQVKNSSLATNLQTSRNDILKGPALKTSSTATGSANDLHDDRATQGGISSPPHADNLALSKEKGDGGNNQTLVPKSGMPGYGGTYDSKQVDKVFLDAAEKAKKIVGKDDAVDRFLGNGISGGPDALGRFQSNTLDKKDIFTDAPKKTIAPTTKSTTGGGSEDQLTQPQINQAAATIQSHNRPSIATDDSFVSNATHSPTVPVQMSYSDPSQSVSRNQVYLAEPNPVDTGVGSALSAPSAPTATQPEPPSLPVISPPSVSPPTTGSTGVTQLDTPHGQIPGASGGISGFFVDPNAAKSGFHPGGGSNVAM